MRTEYELICETNEWLKHQHYEGVVADIAVTLAKKQYCEQHCDPEHCFMCGGSGDECRITTSPGKISKRAKIRDTVGGIVAAIWSLLRWDMYECDAVKGPKE